MAASVLTVGATVQCPHAGSVSAIASSHRVRADGQPAVTVADTFPVAGCAFTLPTVPPKPQPCVTVRWLVGATRVRVSGQPVLLKSSSGIAQSAEQIPQGPPNVILAQTRVRGT
jgi:hypothetical protein